MGLRRRLRQLGYEELAVSDDAPRLAAERARQGDPALRELFTDVGRYLGGAIAAMVHALDVERVVLAGGLVGASDLFLEATRAAMRDHVFSSMGEGVEVLVGTLGDDAGIVGAATLI